MSFAQKLIAWQRRHGRRGLPWQGTRDPYRVWLSEVMLQQTQVATVVPYYQRFLSKYPTVKALALASEDEVLRLWSGLGYYARGRNLHAAAREVVQRGSFPRTAQDLQTLPGIGRSTAAAIAVFAFGERAAILDGNVKRVLSRVYGVEDESALWPLAERLLPRRGIETYTQALMDLGATVCTRNPQCGACPLASECVARRDGRVRELPARRPRRPLPLRRATWFVVMNADKVLLERRPAPGIWGGLWCFPEKMPAVAVRSTRELAPIDHGFTHFRLRIQPLLCEVKSAAGDGWLTLREAWTSAVPAPVRELLRALRSGARAARARRRARAAPASPRTAAAGAPRAGRLPRRKSRDGAAARRARGAAR
jgi:A/G-specific adenine glycosylase